MISVQYMKKLIYIKLNTTLFRSMMVTCVFHSSSLKCQKKIIKYTFPVLKPRNKEYSRYVYLFSPKRYNS